MRLIMIGFMASGKSTMAKLLSRRWQVENHDLDVMIQRRAGLSIPKYFQKFGEAGFRKLESQTLKIALGMKGILSTGGGTPVQPKNFDLIQQQSTPVVFLNASDQTIRKRLIRDGAGSRPLFRKLGMTGMIKLKHQRQNKYERLADVIVDVNNQRPEFNVKRIVSKLGELQND